MNESEEGGGGGGGGEGGGGGGDGGKGTCGTRVAREARSVGLTMAPRGGHRIDAAVVALASRPRAAVRHVLGTVKVQVLEPPWRLAAGLVCAARLGSSSPYSIDRTACPSD